MSIKIFFDENLPKLLPEALQLLSEVKDPSIEVKHLFHKFQSGTRDVDWITSLAKEGGWVVITMDKNKGGEEWRIFKEAGLTTFKLVRSWKDLTHWERTKRIVSIWDQIVSRAKSSGKYYRIQNNGKIEEIQLL